MSIIIAMANHKGGVAKTASVAALGTIFAAAGHRVLMVDLDTQANLTYSFINMEEKPPRRFVYNAMLERRSLPQVPVKENLFLVPSSLEMTVFEERMFAMRRREYLLQDILLPVDDKYDMILLDCPPSLGNMTTNALVVADRLMVPMNTDQLSYNGLKMMQANVERMEDLNAHLKIDDIFFTRYNKGEKLTEAWQKTVTDEFGEDVVMKTVIRRNNKVSDAVSHFCSIVDYAPESNGAQDYRALARELSERLMKSQNKQ